MIDILLVEDNRVDAELFTRAFIEEVQDPPLIQVVTDGEEAIETINIIKPRLILLDLNLPKTSGFEVLQEIRQNTDPTINLTPVIILTNSRSPQDVVKAYAYRCNAFIYKPIGFPEIIQTTKRITKFWLKCATLPTTSFIQLPSVPPIPPSS